MGAWGISRDRRRFAAYRTRYTLQGRVAAQAQRRRRAALLGAAVLWLLSGAALFGLWFFWLLVATRPGL